MNKNDALWISWEWHRRSISLTDKMEIPIAICTSSLPGPFKRLHLIIKTVAILLAKKPKILFVQNPSAFLTILSILLKPFFKYLLVVDAHNAGVYPFERGHEKFQAVYPFMHRNADRTIVTNEILAEIINNHNGKPIILPDLLPKVLSNRKSSNTSDIFTVTFICSYSSDEPYMEVILAAERLPENVQINITGNYKKLPPTVRSRIRKNVHLTGFLNERDYVDLLSISDVIMDLTTFDDCLVCGAYEAVSLGVPIILSNTRALRWWFHKGVIFTKNEKHSIKEAILLAKERLPILKKEVKELKYDIDRNWNRLYEEFTKDLIILKSDH